MAWARRFAAPAPLGMLLCLGLCGCSAPSSVTSVSVLASPTLLGPGQSSTLVASVLGAGDFIPDVTFTLEAGAPGLLSASTGSSVLYTAPTTVTAPQAVSVTASSVVDVDVFGMAVLTLEPADGGFLVGVQLPARSP
jgi:hypothetical protein